MQAGMSGPGMESGRLEKVGTECNPSRQEGQGKRGIEINAEQGREVKVKPCRQVG